VELKVHHVEIVRQVIHRLRDLVPETDGVRMCGCVGARCVREKGYGYHIQARKRWGKEGCRSVEKKRTMTSVEVRQEDDGGALGSRRL
jgi:hypothetical protein